MKIYLSDNNFIREIKEIFSVFFIYEIELCDINDSDIKIIIRELEIEIYDLELRIKNKVDMNIYNKKERKREIKCSIFKFLQKKIRFNPKWGILTGIRPSKIADKMINEGYSDDEIIKYYKEKYLVSEEKSKLAIKISKSNHDINKKNESYVSIYLSIPFCMSICTYCTFGSLVYEKYKNYTTRYLEALNKEIIHTIEYIEKKNLKISSIYFGGGTPTAIDEENFEKMLSFVYNNLLRGNNSNRYIEYTLEAGRSDTITENKLLSMKKYGVNRISINPQSMVDKTLSKIGRKDANYNSVKEAFYMARKLGFDNINMDLILGLSGEKIEDIEFTLKEVLKLKPDSITIHPLAIKKGSKSSSFHEKHYIKDIDIAERMSEISLKSMNEIEMVPYYLYRQKKIFGNLENIGFSKIGKECIYNSEIIEEYRTIIGIGMGAVSKKVSDEKINRYFNFKNIDEYINKIDESTKEKENMLNS